MTKEKLKPVDLLHQVVKEVDIIDILLINQNMAINIHPNDLNDVELDITHGLKRINFNHNKENNVLSVILTLDLRAVRDEDSKEKLEEKKNKDLFHMTFTFCVNYSTNAGSEFTDESLNIFSRTNAIYNAYPYFRNSIQESCAKLAIMPIVLPFLKPFSANQINNMFVKKDIEETDGN